MRAVGVGEVLRVNGRLGRQGRLNARGQVVGGEGLEGHSTEGLHLLRIALDAEHAFDELDVIRAALELMRGNDLRLLDESIRRPLDRLSPNREGTRTIGVHAVWRTTGVAVDHLDVLDRDPEHAARDLAPGGLMALAVWRGAGDDLDLAGREQANGAVLPAACDVLQCA